MNAVSVDGRFVPLTVTDRLLAEPPAFGVALAHAWPSAHPTEAVVEAAAAAVGRARDRERPDATRRSGSAPTAGPYVMEVAARLGGGHDAELCHAATGVDLNDLAVSFALGRIACDKLSQGSPPARVGGGACVVFLVAPEGELRRRRASRRPRRSTASSGCGSTGSPAGASGRCGAAPTAPARSSRPARPRGRRSRGLAVRRRPYASWSMRTPS